MSILSDHDIVDLIRGSSNYPSLISDAYLTQQNKTPSGAPAMSWGVSSYGYDLRLDNTLLIMRDYAMSIVDPKNFSPALMEEMFIEDHKHLSIPPRGFVLGSSKEVLTLPRDCIATVVGKSSYARCGIIISATALEPEWSGTVNLEIFNCTPYPARIYPGEGICQLLFFKGDRACLTSYADRNGKYQNQTGVTIARP